MKTTFFRSKKSSDGGAKTDSRPEPKLSTASPSSPSPSSWRHRAIWSPASRSPATPDTPISPQGEDSGLGLHLLKSPESPQVDIIFVHGLGGHSQKTWCKDHNSELFWPKLWLPLEPGMETTRILTFGYNANWGGMKRTISSISEFAEQLHNALRYSDVVKKGDPKIGDNPIIFVAHSMGGLVVKKLLGLANDDYHNSKTVFDAIKAIVFLSTPHAGTDLAGTLNKILSVSFQSPKIFVSQLQKHSSFILDINRQFGNLSKKLAIWVFYETLATSIGPGSTIIVEKPSSTLFHPDAIFEGLNADHHGVCKFASPKDNNYRIVTAAIKSLVSRLREQKLQQPDAANSRLNTTDIADSFQNCPSPSPDYSALWMLHVPGTCDWFVHRPEVVEWLKTDLQPRLLWHHDLPGRGKSVLASFMIHELKKYGNCQFFFFRDDDPSKTSIFNCLRSLALQMSRTLPSFKTLLAKASPQGLGLDSDNADLVWQRIFVQGLFKLRLSNPIYWVIDGLDQSDSPRTLIHCLESLLGSGFPAKVLLISRNTNDISLFVNNLSHFELVSCVSEKDAATANNGIRLLVEREISRLPGDAASQKGLAKTIIRLSEGSFLWTHLVLHELEKCYTKVGVEAILREVPRDMVAFYQKMERNLVNKTKPRNLPLISALITWITCARRPMSIAEIEHALKDKYPNAFFKTLISAAGGFIYLDSSEDGMVTVSHHTVREYMTRNSDSRLYIEPQETHWMLCLRMLAVLQERNFEVELRQNQAALQASDPFVFFAATSWPYHLSHSKDAAATAESIVAFMDQILPFLRTSAVLNWINIVALTRQLQLLVRAAEALTAFASSARKRAREQRLDPLPCRSSDIDEIEKWAFDLVKIFGKFGHKIKAEPLIIYDAIPALCPSASMMRKRFHDGFASRIFISNNEELSWNANFGQLLVSGDGKTLGLTCSGNYVAVQGSDQVVTIWDAVGFDEVCKIKHGEVITAICLGDNGSKLATYGMSTTKIWEIPSSKLLCVAQNPSNIKAKALAFSDSVQSLFSAGGDNVVRYLEFNNNTVQDSSEWLELHLWMPNEHIHELQPRAFLSMPACIEFNRDCSQVAVSYRSAPLVVCSMDDGHLIGALRRAKSFLLDSSRVERARSATASQTNWFGVKRFTWNRPTGHVLGIYKDGTLFKWHPLKDDNEEVVATSRDATDGIAASPNGQIFASSSSNGRIRLWNFETFRVIHMFSTGDLVSGLVFSPDGRRLYDIRNDRINAWEPDCLLEPVNGSDITSDRSGRGENSGKIYTNVQMPALPVFEKDVVESVTALAVSPDGQMYCVGYGSGWYSLGFRGRVREEIRADRLGTLEVCHITWSRNGDMVALADLGRNVQIKALREPTTTTTTTGTSPSPRVEMELRCSLRIDSGGCYSMEKLMFSPDSERLFIWAGANIYLFSVDGGALMASAAIEQQQQQQQSSRQWLCWGDGPNACLVSFSKAGIEAFDWHTLERLDSEALRPEAVATAAAADRNSYNDAMGSIGAVMTEPPSFLLGDMLAALTGSVRYQNARAKVAVEEATRTQDRKHILLQVSVCSRGEAGKPKELADSSFSSKDLVVLPDCRLDSGTIVSSSPLLAKSRAKIAGLISVPLGVLPDRKLVFLDKDMWLCTVPLDDAMADGVDQHVVKFCFIPHDWISSDSLSLCFMAQDGAVFWPHGETVEIIESDLKTRER